ncbi:hypothetical protein [Soonwooa sp.]|uniref:hypothetical protein n=1 Tax=Soonwooa sp. TaxID=1938592 RepID=UPI0026207B1E|nr:hypothetical protein [Soonwooa sp.]
MNRKNTLFIIVVFITNIISAQTRSLREMLLDADVVVITENISKPLFLQQKKLPITDNKSYVLVDSIRILSYLRKPKIDLSNKKFVVDNTISNAFSAVMSIPRPVDIVLPGSTPLPTKTLLIGKTSGDLVKILDYEELNESAIKDVEEFMTWLESIAKKKDDEKCKLYISKYISMLRGNYAKKGLMFFDNILLPDSDFMLYYKSKSPTATQLTAVQKEALKEYFFDGTYYDDVRQSELIYSFFPQEVLDFYKTNLAEVRTYDEEFKEMPAKWNDFIKFTLEKTNKWNRDSEILLDIIDDYYSSNTSLKRDAFERLIEKIKEN